MLKNQINKIIQNKTVSNIAVVAIITILVKFVGFYKEVKVAEEFGLSELLDTFYIALLIPGLINQVFLISFKSVFIPNYIAELKEKKEAASFQTVSFVITIGLGLIFTLISFFFTDFYLDIFFPDHTESYYGLVKIQFHYLAPCLVIWGLNALLSGILNIFDEFKYSSVYPILTSILMLVCLLGFQNILQERVLAVGMLLGSLAEFIFLLIVSLRKGIIKFSTPDFTSKNTRMMLREFPARITSSFLTGMVPATDQYFAGQLAIGSITALNYGYKVPAFISAIAIVALGNVLLPYFSKLILDNKETAYERLYTIIKVLFGGILAVIIPLCFLSYFVIEILFERGAFTANDTNTVGLIQIVYFLALPFSICTDVLVRFLTGINKNTFMAVVSFISLLLNIIFNYIFMKLYGVMGIALCTTAIEALKFGVFYMYSKKLQKT
ncbi:virulence factor MviN [Mangrovimonas sp. CR14]|uniref:murein biosynthesis integral membrane protein MurJ n=1 Tax=Mangrovimonas sp. CR14 TaxID=2706120 RepID=UPI00142457B7|nr:lipid II flippase MurJ [Mangrovimonas sp. CR14]NIK91891.1 virulence factor MviN [Mangrovimonas sp. CR14]